MEKEEKCGELKSEVAAETREGGDEAGMGQIVKWSTLKPLCLHSGLRI